MWKTKGKEEKEEASQNSSGSQESRGRGEAAKSHLREPDKKRKRAERGRQIQKCLVATGQSTRSGSAEALNQIRDLEKEIKSLKEANNPIKRLTDLFGRILEE